MDGSRDGVVTRSNSRVVEAGSPRPGGFVTVTTDDDGRGVAVALQVIRPEA